MVKFSLEEVNNMYMDVLKEIGNIGAGNATTAIAKKVEYVYGITGAFIPIRAPITHPIIIAIKIISFPPILCI